MENKEYNKALEVLIQNINEITDFTKEQLPDVARQILEYGAWDAEYGMTLSAVVACVSGITSMICFIRFCINDDNIGSVFLGGLSLTVFLLSCIGIVGNYTILKQIELAPKYYLIEKIRG